MTLISNNFEQKVENVNTDKNRNYLLIDITDNTWKKINIGECMWTKPG